MRTLLICHEGDVLNEQALARWLASFSELAGLVVLRETRRRQLQRIRRELRRVGPLRFADVLAFRIYYRLVLAKRDRAWEAGELDRLNRVYAPLDPDLPVLHTSSPNSAEAETFITRVAPDIMIARCKALLKESVFTIPTAGTFAMHPGICPEYRNAHGCFWALARGDLSRVGMTLLRIDRGADTGAVFGFYSYPYDEVGESHVVIQHRVVLENLDALKARLLEIAAGTAQPIDTSGRESGAWGQPWLTKYIAWKLRARRST